MKMKHKLEVHAVQLVKALKSPPNQYLSTCRQETYVEPESASWIPVTLPKQFVRQLQSTARPPWWVQGITGASPGEVGLVQGLYQGHQEELVIANTTDAKIKYHQGQVLGEIHILPLRTSPAGSQKVCSAGQDKYEGPEELRHRLGGEAAYLLEACFPFLGQMVAQAHHLRW